MIGANHGNAGKLTLGGKQRTLAAAGEIIGAEAKKSMDEAVAQELVDQIAEIDRIFQETKK